jgi:probable rRNA maturation factor
MAITVPVTIEDAAWRTALAAPSRRVARIVRRTLRHVCPSLDAATISVLLTGDAQQQTLNRDWRGKDMATNVLSFPARMIAAGETPTPEFDGVPLELGDLALALETCVREAREQAKPLDHHLDHLVIHGVLHLLGYDHIDDTDASIMETLEVSILAGLGIPDPYAGALEERASDG